MNIKEEFIKRYSQQCKLPQAKLLKCSNLLKDYINESITMGVIEAIELSNGWKKLIIKPDNKEVE